MPTSSDSTPSSRPPLFLPHPKPGPETFLSDPENASLCKPIPEPYLLNPLTIGPLDTPSVEENDQAYQRHHFFRELNEAARRGRRPFYEGGMFGWLPIYWNVGWAGWLRELGDARQADAGGENQSSSEIAEAHRRRRRILVEVEEDATTFVPDTDVEPAMQRILKDMYWEYVVEEEVRRRVLRGETLRQMPRQGCDKKRCPAALLAGSEATATGFRGRLERMPEPEEREVDLERMMEQLTSFAEFLDEEGGPVAEMEGRMDVAT